MGWGQEVPIPKSYCGGQSTCSWQSSITVSTTQTWTVNTNVGLGTREEAPAGDAALTASFDVGASYSYSKTLSYTTGNGDAKQLGTNQCGCKYCIPSSTYLACYYFCIVVN